MDNYPNMFNLLNAYFQYVCLPIGKLLEQTTKETGLVIAVIWSFVIVPACVGSFIAFIVGTFWS